MPRLSLARLTPRRMLHLPARTVRLRLALLYSGLFLVSGAVLLAIEPPRRRGLYVSIVCRWAGA
jgi:hypothetical protein